MTEKQVYRLVRWFQRQSSATQYMIMNEDENGEVPSPRRVGRRTDESVIICPLEQGSSPNGVLARLF